MSGGEAESSPSWGRGLKSIRDYMAIKNKAVVPLVGTWIEIYMGVPVANGAVVVPLVGTWIEIAIHDVVATSPTPSSSSWGRGLKYLCKRQHQPLWRRPPRGDVD